MSKSGRRVIIILNYIAATLVVTFFYLGDRSDWAGHWLIAAIIALAVVIVTFIPVYSRTGLWKFVHTGVDKLDEREALLTYESLRRSYRIFSVIILLFIQLSYFTGFGDRWVSDSTSQVVFWCIFYLAHTLPASVIAWTAREV